MYFLKAICPSTGMEIVHRSPTWTCLEEAQKMVDYQMQSARQLGYSSYYQVVTEGGQVLYNPHAGSEISRQREQGKGEEKGHRDRRP